MESMASWYGLKSDHKDFYIENDADGRLLFARSELDDQLQAILRRSFRSSNPPKFVLYGDWGVGKTHTMRHIQYVVDTTEGFSARIVFVELPDISARSTFQVAHAALLDGLGIDVVKNWMVQFQTKYQSRSAEIIQQHTQSGDIARAFQTLISYGEAARICWDWLRGIPLSGPDAKSVGLSPHLEQSNQLANVLRMLGRLSRDIEDKTLVFMLDEATKLNSVSNGDAINHWVNAIKILSDTQTKEVGLIISASFRDPDEMGEALSDQQIRTRFGEKNYILLPNFGPEKAREFIVALLAEWVDDGKREAIIKSYSSQTDGEQLTPSTFPFTSNALTGFVEYCCRNGNYTTPRDIQKSMDDILNRAIDDNRHIVSGIYLSSLLTMG